MHPDFSATQDPCDWFNPLKREQIGLISFKNVGRRQRAVIEEITQKMWMKLRKKKKRII